MLRELVDNALDAGAKVSLVRTIDHEWVVTDNGPGIDPTDIPRLFSINRPLVSTKLPRYPLRGMLGNGLRVVMGAVTVSNGMLVVETRGHRLTLAVNPATGLTHVTNDETIPVSAGLTVRINFGPEMPSHGDAEAISHGKAFAFPDTAKDMAAHPRLGGMEHAICTA